MFQQHFVDIGPAFNLFTTAELPENTILVPTIFPTCRRNLRTTLPRLVYNCWIFDQT